jgi:thiol-disulfide isomerase/thioredoxin
MEARFEAMSLADVTLPDLTGRPSALIDLSHRVVLLHLFATWCEPCRKELPRIAAISAGAEGPALFAVSLAEPPQRVERFLASLDLQIGALLDTDRALSRRLGIGVLPSTLVLGPGLSPFGFAEGDVDWTRPDILAWLGTIGRLPSPLPVIPK